MAFNSLDPPWWMRWLWWLAGGLVVLLAGPAVGSLAYRWDGSGGSAAAVVLLLVVVTAGALIAVVVIARRRYVDLLVRAALIAGELSERTMQVRQLQEAAAEDSRDWADHVERLRDQVRQAVRFAAEQQVPMALADRPVPARPAERSAPVVDDLLDEMVGQVRLVCERHDGQMESQQLALVAVAGRLQTAMHRVQELAAQTAERHQDIPPMYGACLEIDHLATTAARYAQRVAVLCGGWEGQQWDEPLRLAMVAQAAQARIEDWRRVEVTGDPDVGVDAEFLEPVTHTLAELLDNATRFSPPGAAVSVTVEAVSAGAAIQIEDRGLGMEETTMAQAQAKVSGRHPVGLAELGEVPLMGLATVGCFARRYGLRVDLGRSRFGGVRATVFLPAEMVVPVDPPGATFSAPALTTGTTRSTTSKHMTPPAVAPDVEPAATPIGELAMGMPQVAPGRPVTSERPRSQDAAPASGRPGERLPELPRRRRAPASPQAAPREVMPGMAVPPESPQEAATFLSAFDAGLTEATGQADRAEHGDVTDGRHE